jgi:hypothetical protein
LNIDSPIEYEEKKIQKEMLDWLKEPTVVKKFDNGKTCTHFKACPLGNRSFRRMRKLKYHIDSSGKNDTR